MNDYIFKVFLQRNETALRGLLCALLNLKEEEICSVEILNPILEGETIDNKTVILDIRLLLNSNQIINIEMQVDNLGNWEERSLTYLCRAFNQLNKGDDYEKVMKTVQIGILNFTPDGFPGILFSDYYLYNRANRHVYSDKLCIKVLQLNQLGRAEDEKQMPQIYHWAQLFRAGTWEEIAMLAEKNTAIKAGMTTLREITADEKIQMEAEAREDYRRNLASATKHGEKIGEERGRQIGERGLIETCRDFGASKEDTRKRLVDKFAISDAEAEKLIEQYWK